MILLQRSGESSEELTDISSGGSEKSDLMILMEKQGKNYSVHSMIFLVLGLKEKIN